jgi:hypothetical protein
MEPRGLFHGLTQVRPVEQILDLLPQGHLHDEAPSKAGEAADLVERLREIVGQPSGEGA